MRASIPSCPHCDRSLVALAQERQKMGERIEELERKAEMIVEACQFAFDDMAPMSMAKEAVRSAHGIAMSMRATESESTGEKP